MSRPFCALASFAIGTAIIGCAVVAIYRDMHIEPVQSCILLGLAWIVLAPWSASVFLGPRRK